MISRLFLLFIIEPHVLDIDLYIALNRPFLQIPPCSCYSLAIMLTFGSCIALVMHFHFNLALSEGRFHTVAENAEPATDQEINN